MARHPFAWRRVWQPRLGVGVRLLALTAGLAGALAPNLSGQSRTAAGQTPARGTWNVPRLPGGDPDLEGVWNYGTATPLERPAQWAGRETISEGEAAAWEQQAAARRGQSNATAGPDWWEPQNGILKNRRTSLIVDPADGRLPPAAASAARRGRGRGNGYDGPESLGLQERCVAWPAAAPPYTPTVYNNNIGIVQTRDHIVLQSEMIHVARIVRMNARHGTPRSMYGDATGRWEGATLVVDTINFDGRLNYRNTGDRLHLVEKFTRTGPDALAYEFTVEDSDTWTRPWTARVDMTKIDQPIYEFACHEGNASSVTTTLKAERMADQAK
jgi:hypothetical protein